MNALSGKLQIRLTRDGDGVHADVTPPPRIPVADLVRGKSADQTATLIPLIFNICAAAQEAAVRSALSLEIDDALRQNVRIETLREHAMKLLMIWPPLLGVTPDRAAIGYAAAALDDADAEAALRAAIFGADGAVPADWMGLEAWMTAAATVPAEIFDIVHRDFQAAWGRTDTPLFDPEVPVDWDSGAQNGGPVDNGPACRVADVPLMQAVEERFGRGVLWRMTARLIEVERLLDGDAGEVVSDTGISQAARGAMLVQARCDDTGVHDFARLSPTDFALMQGGVLEQALASLPGQAGAPLETVARMVIETVDPCIVTQVETHHA